MGKYCFDEEAFSVETFEVTAFLEACRTRSPMETIYQDLKHFQTTLENQLVAIINEDYTEFLQLSSKLKGVDEAVSSVRAPILAALKRVDEVQNAMNALQNKIQTQIQTAKDLQEEERELRLSIKISEKLLLLESLLEIESFVEIDHDEMEQVILSDKPLLNSDEESDDEFENFERIKKQLYTEDAAENCAKLERAAQLFVQVDTEFVNGMRLATIQREEKRLAVVEETLLRRLETEFATEIFPDTFYNRDHSISAVALGYLLRAYVLLRKSHIPEEMIGRLVVKPFAEENITRGRLDGRARGSCEGLPQIYECILDFITSKFEGILVLSVCQGESKCSVDILGNAIWKHLQEILSTKHSIIFQAADTNRFHHNYTISMRFLADMEERFCKSETMKSRFRSHESVVDFKEKWNVDVYFQLQASQIVASLEKSFDVKRDEPVVMESFDGTTSTVTDESGLVLENSKILWKAIQDCWSERIFLEPLLPKFCKLCMQLLTYSINMWKEPLLKAVKELNSGVKVDWNNTPLLTSKEDLLFAGSDFHVLYGKPLRALAEMETSCWSTAVTTVAIDCKKVLPAIRYEHNNHSFEHGTNIIFTIRSHSTVKGQYQMTNKPPPTSPSTYVANIVRPMQDFLEKWGVHFDTAKRQQLLQAIVDDVCVMYSTLSSDLLRSALELEESLKSRKLHRAASSLSGDKAVSDSEKMRMQLRLDLEEFQR
ncbi:hypothetical protein PsorP6_002645 [Peronosclerospora sorghi]|uniref:Uncharacterized protein n=1 Tax=Peronosclerospora sorghi TaxID=230839 RepID=A0ACC0WVZ7_9STRA|nr:hypothetical protein PsorP6_002645 [Peronosclerospora sorghi]